MANDDDEKKSNLPEGYVIVPNEERDLPPEEKHPAGTYKAAPAKPAQPAPQARGVEPSREGMIGEMGKRTGVYGEKEHPAIGLAKEAIEDISNGEYQQGAHKLFGAVSETLRPLAPLGGTSGAALAGLGASMLGGQAGKYAGPKIGLTPELGEDIGSYGVGAATLPHAIARGLHEGGPAYRAGRPALMGAGEPVPETPPTEEPLRELPRTGAPPQAPPAAPEQPLAAPTAQGQLDAIARRLYGRPYELLSQEQKAFVAKQIGAGGPGGIERRVTEGQGPVAERRAERMPMTAGAQRGLQATPTPEGGEIARPGATGEEGTLPRTGPPSAPPPVTLGGQRAPKTLNEAIDMATGARRGQPGAEAKPPPGEDPLKTEFPDPAVRRLVRANGPELLRSGADADAIQAVHALTNVDIRQAAINAGIDVGQKHVGSRIGLGPEQISRQELIAQMLGQGVKAEDIPGLARMEPGTVDYTKRMPIPKTKTSGELGQEQIHHHELFHAILGELGGFDPQGVVSHRNPVLMKGGAAPGASAAVLYDFRQFTGGTGKLNPVLLLARDNGKRFVMQIAGGAAANEVIDGIHRYDNPGLQGDVNMAGRFFEALGFPRKNWPELWEASIDSAKQLLTPEVQNIIKHEATFREDNLPVGWHYSKARIQAIVDRIHEAHEQSYGPEGRSGYGKGIVQPGDRGGEAINPQAEGQGAGRTATLPRPGERLSPFQVPQITYHFKVQWAKTLPPQEVEIQAPNITTAYKKLSSQGDGGFYRADLLTRDVPMIGPPVKLLPGSSVPLMKHPPEISGEGPSTLDVAKQLNRYTRSQIGSLSLAKAAPEKMVGRARELAIEEAQYQLAQANSGKEWYKADLAKQDQILKNELRPELKDPTKLSLFKFAEAILSLSKKPYTNLKQTFPAWDYYRENGVFNPVQPSGKSWGPAKAQAYGNAFRYLNELVDRHGEKGAVDWILSEHPTSELRAFNKKVPGEADEMQHGAMIFGDKRGPFALNLHGMEAAFTADRWVSRTWNRWMGTIEWDNETGKMLTDAPRGPKERALMKQSFAEAAEYLGLSTSQLQAVLWYYEQGLYRAMGAAKESGNYAAAARRIADEAAAKPSASGRARLPGRTSRAPSRRP